VIEKLECNCIEAYKTRKMRDPNCCACSCDHNDLVEQLAKANERCSELESYNVALANESHEYQQRCELLERVETIFNESPDLTFEDVKATFSSELNKFALEQKIEAATLFASSVNETGQFGWSDCQWLTDYAEEWAEQLRKEQP
jgi:hypothetical protein